MQAGFAIGSPSSPWRSVVETLCVETSATSDQLRDFLGFRRLDCDVDLFYLLHLYISTGMVITWS